MIDDSSCLTSLQRLTPAARFDVDNLHLDEPHDEWGGETLRQRIKQYMTMCKGPTVLDRDAATNFQVRAVCYACHACHA